MQSTFFFPSRNRPTILRRCLDSIRQHSPKSTVFVANCSTTERIKESSLVIEEFKSSLDVEETIYFPDPGCAFVYNDLFQKIRTEYAIVWADDMLLTRNLDDLYSNFNDFSVNLVALPMIDDLSEAPLMKSSWPKDHHSCALWQTPTGRCAHHTIVRTSYFQRFDNVYLPNEYIDNFFHNHTLPQMRVWPSDGAYCLHTRIDDDTRYNMKITEDTFRFSEATRKTFNDK